MGRGWQVIPSSAGRAAAEFGGWRGLRREKGLPTLLGQGGGVSRNLLERGGAERRQELVRGIGKGVEAKGSARTQVARQGPTGNTSMVLWCREEARARGRGASR